MTDVGDIFSPEAYAQGKMLDHSGWQSGDRILPRRITPSDFDMVIDNAGHLLLVELSSSNAEWNQLKSGQVRSYQAAIQKGDCHCAVLCRHNVTPETGRKINTRSDIVSFQAMVWHLCAYRISKVVEGNINWQNFLFAWCNNPVGLRGTVILHSQPYRHFI